MVVAASHAAVPNWLHPSPTTGTVSDPIRRYSTIQPSHANVTGDTGGRWMVQSSQVPDRDAPYRPITMGLTPGAGVTIRTIADLDGYLGAVADAGFRAVSLSGAHMCGDPASA